MFAVLLENDTKQMIPHSSPFIARLSLIGLCLFSWVSCSEQQAATPPKGRPPTPVRVAPVLKQVVQQTVKLVGSVEPWKRSTVASEIEGLVHQYPAAEGMRVKKGDLLAKLRTDTLQIRLDSALASHREAQTRYQQAKLDLARIRVLFEKELVTQKEMDDAQAEEAALQERLSQLDAQIRQVRDQMTKSSIFAPFDGWVTKEFTEVGQWVEVGGAIIEMVDLSHVKIEVPLPERFVQDTHQNDPVLVSFDSLPGLTVEGTVYSVVAQADRNARTFPVKIDIPNPDLTIKSGMVANVALQVGKRHEGVVIPKDALVLRGQQNFVFLVKDGTVEQIPIHPVTHLDTVVEVQGNLQEGMTVVVEGNERLFPGQPVRILTAQTQ